MIMNLVLKTDVKKTEAALSKYKEANTDIIKANAALERNEAAAFQSRQAHEKEQANLRLQAALQEHEDDRLRRIERGNLTLKALAAGQSNTSGVIARSSNKEADDQGPVSDPSGLVKGLRKIRAPPPRKVYDPFMGIATKRDYYDVRADYPSIRLTKAKNDNRTKAGGFDFQAYFDESLLRAFAGLGCFIEEEQAGRDQPVSRQLATVVAAEASPGKMSDEIF
jgi:CDK-activating kinase assembly factor MAT1